MAEENQSDIIALTVQLLSAFVSNNIVSSENLPELIKSTRAALTNDATTITSEPAPEIFTPSVSVRKSLSSPDHILSLIDGKPYKTLKRHLAKHGLTPEQYRERYDLPKTYPMVAQSYSDSRRAVAEKLGLGRKPTIAAEAAKPTEVRPPVPAAPAPEAAEIVPAPKVKKPVKAKGGSAKLASSLAGNAPASEVTPMVTPKKRVAKARKDASGNAAPISAESAAKVAPVVKKEPRKRLSIAAAKGEKPANKAETVTRKSATGAKAKSGPKPNSSKAASA